MTHIRRFDHVGITVADLTGTPFFVGLGLEVEGRMFIDGEFLDTVIGIPDSRTEIVMLRPPDGGTGWSSSSFIRPDHEPVTRRDATELGLRNCPSRWTTSRRPSTGWPRTATACGRHRSVRGHRAHGLRARAGGDHRVPGRADRLAKLTGRGRTPCEDIGMEHDLTKYCVMPPLPPPPTGEIRRE